MTADKFEIQSGSMFVTALLSVLMLAVWTKSGGTHALGVGIGFGVVGFSLVAGVFDLKGRSTGLFALSTLLAPLVYIEYGTSLAVFASEVVTVLAIGYYLGRAVQLGKAGGWQLRATLFFFYMSAPLCVVLWTLSLDTYGVWLNTLLLFIALGCIWVPCKLIVGRHEDRARLLERIECFVG